MVASKFSTVGRLLTVAEVAHHQKVLLPEILRPTLRPSERERDCLDEQVARPSSHSVICSPMALLAAYVKGGLFPAKRHDLSVPVATGQLDRAKILEEEAGDLPGGALLDDEHLPPSKASVSCVRSPAGEGGEWAGGFTSS